MLENERKVCHCSMDLSFDEEAELEAAFQLCLYNVSMYYSIVKSWRLWQKDKASKAISKWWGKIPASSSLLGFVNEKYIMCTVA